MRYCTIALLAGLSFLCSCSTPLPTIADFQRYDQQAQELADRQIALLDQQVKRGQLSKSSRDRQAELIRAEIPRKSAELAWTHHELRESELRAWGMPTGDSTVALHTRTGSTVPDTLRQQRGDQRLGYQDELRLSSLTQQASPVIVEPEPNASELEYETF